MFTYILLIISSIIILIASFLLADFLWFYKEVKVYIPHWTFKQVIEHYKRFTSRDLSKEAMDQMIIYDEERLYNPVMNKGAENSILLFGCSFVFGYKIPKEKTLHSVLARHTQKAIYDRSLHGWGPNQMLYQLQHEDFYKIVPKPDTIIYTYMGEHIKRIYAPTLDTITQYRGAFYKYNKKDNTLVKRKDSEWYEKYILITKLLNKIYWNLPDNQTKVKALLKHFEEAKKEVDKHWGTDTKFIILIYFHDYFSEKIRTMLEIRGYTVIYREDLVHFKRGDDEYLLDKNNSSPNEKAWEAIVPKLMEHL